MGQGHLKIMIKRYYSSITYLTNTVFITMFNICKYFNITESNYQINITLVVKNICNS